MLTSGLVTYHLIETTNEQSTQVRHELCLDQCARVCDPNHTANLRDRHHSSADDAALRLLTAKGAAFRSATRGNRVSISLGIDVGAVSVKLAAIGELNDSFALSRLCESNKTFFLPSLPAGSNGGAKFPIVLSAYRRLQGNPSETTNYLLREFCEGVLDESIVRDLCDTLEHSCSDAACHMDSVRRALLRARDRFRSISARYDANRPLIGVLGEIFCRLNNFSNQELVRRLEAHGAECWMTDIAEWIAYTNVEEVRNLRQADRSYSWAMLKSKLRARIQSADEHTLVSLFAEEFVGYEEPGIDQVLNLTHPYLPFAGAEGEMVASLGRGAYLAMHGVDGLVDISPFTCMNGIVSEAIYPKLSRDYAGIPNRNFYFDGQQSDLEQDIEIYLELARSYGARKPYRRCYPVQFRPDSD
jgi:hypothetical protein